MMASKKDPISKPGQKVVKSVSSKVRPENPLKIEVITLISFMTALFLFISITKFQGNPEDVEFIGWAGTKVAQGLGLLLGKGAVYFSLLMLAWSIHTGILKKLWSNCMLGLCLIYMDMLIWLSIYDIPGGITILSAGLKGLGGGIIGCALAHGLISIVGQVGAVIFILMLILVSFLLILNRSMAEIVYVLKNIVIKLIQKAESILFYPSSANENAEKSLRVAEPIIIEPVQNTESIRKQPELNIYNINGKNQTEAQVSDKDEKIRLTLVKDNSRSKSENYNKPPLELLSEISSERTIDKKNIKESISILEDTFANFGVGVKVNQVSCGPTVTRYELTPAPGVKVSKIISLTDDLQLNLAAPGIRIEAPIPGKSAVGIEVPNSKILSVGIRNLLSSSNFKTINTPLAFALGEDISGVPVFGKLSDMPHLLIAGSTGSGKSVCLNGIITSFLYNADPEELKLVFIDPKMVELTVYNGIPHLLAPVVTDPKKASVVLRWMVAEMEKRYKLFAELGVRDIVRYNQSSKEKIPYIVIVIDELADLMMVAPIEVEDSICRLAQMARAAGMHLIVATQRPSVDVVTGVIKANIPSRIAFAVSSQADSRTILDIGGAEKLLGKGDMLFFPVGAVKPFRVQGAFVSDQDIENTVEYIKKQVNTQETAEYLQNIELTLQNTDLEIGDELFWEAVSVFVDSQKASVSLLQRRLRIGYARAARLVDIMEERGIVSAIDSNKKREILIDSEQLEKLVANQSSI
ncbi:MAG: DNA translocase FtsK [Syntrophomonadaceae bacterium]|mgnify:CR=1 FL=1|jgi:S-DNA-T family DNA segregation ATPase FtsK/SpoIIIE